MEVRVCRAGVLEAGVLEAEVLETGVLGEDDSISIALGSVSKRPCTFFCSDKYYLQLQAWLQFQA